MEAVWRVIHLWRFYCKISLDIVFGFHGENMANLITKMASVEIMWRQCGERYFYGDSTVKLVWTSSGAFIEKTWQI